MWWMVYLDGGLIDEVWFDRSCDEWYVRNSLVSHDGYDPNIQVEKA